MKNRTGSAKDNVRPLLDIRFCGRSKYIMMNYHSCQDDGKVFKCWKFFNSKSGLEVFQIDNNFTPKVKDDGAAEGEQPKEYRFIGL